MRKIIYRQIKIIAKPGETISDEETEREIKRGLKMLDAINEESTNKKRSPKG